MMTTASPAALTNSSERAKVHALEGSNARYAAADHSCKLTMTFSVDMARGPGATAGPRDCTVCTAGLDLRWRNQARADDLLHRGVDAVGKARRREHGEML